MRRFDETRSPIRNGWRRLAAVSACALTIPWAGGCVSVPTDHAGPPGHFEDQSGISRSTVATDGANVVRLAAVDASTTAPRIQPVRLPAMPRQRSVDESQPGGPDPAGVEAHPDEFVIDGGDRGNPVHYQSFLRYGVETEDTIAEYTDDEGASHVLPSNRVAIYAPRFAAIRTVQLPIEGFGVERMASAHRLTREVRLTTREGSRQHRQQLGAVDARMRARASGLLGETRTAGMSRLLRSGEHVKLLNVFEETGGLVAGRMASAIAAGSIRPVSASTST